MHQLRFSDDLHTKHDGIDRQHEAMFAWGRKILEMPADVSSLDLSRAINFLGTYVRYHFAAEESLMHKHAYDRAAAHIQQHGALRVLVAEIQQAASNGQPLQMLLSRVYTLFQDWYVYHIAEWDKPFAQHIRSTHQAEDSAHMPTIDQLRQAHGVASVDDLDPDAVEVVSQERWLRAPKRV